MSNETGAAFWQEQKTRAQEVTRQEIGGIIYARIPYGEQDFCAPDGTPFAPGERLPTICHDCDAEVGQYHVPGCDVERCPRCHGQAIACGCVRAGTER